MATLTFNSMTVGTKVKTNISVPNLVISPEVRYNLNLKFACTAISTPTYDFNMYEPATSIKTEFHKVLPFRQQMQVSLLRFTSLIIPLILKLMV
jgi:TATA-box binding protein (TBP) (component of TFIID and TFIIIB)